MSTTTVLATYICSYDTNTTSFRISFLNLITPQRFFTFLKYFFPVLFKIWNINCLRNVALLSMLGFYEFGRNGRRICVRLEVLCIHLVLWFYRFIYRVIIIYLFYIQSVQLHTQRPVPYATPVMSRTQRQSVNQWMMQFMHSNITQTSTIPKLHSTHTNKTLPLLEVPYSWFQSISRARKSWNSHQKTIAFIGTFPKSIYYIQDIFKSRS